MARVMLAAMAGILAGAVVHFMSLAIGMTVTIGGSLFACAVVSASWARLR